MPIYTKDKLVKEDGVEVKNNFKGIANGIKYAVSSLKYCECPDCKEKVYDINAMRIIEAFHQLFISQQAIRLLLYRRQRSCGFANLYFLIDHLKERSQHLTTNIEC